MSNDYFNSLSSSSMANSTSTASSTAANACTSTRWLTEEVFALIDLVQRNEAIYNPRHKYYFCRPYVENFWREVDLKLEKNPGASLAKWTNLRISFRREYTNYLEEKVPPCWTYFDRMFFLHPYLRKKHQQPKSLDSQVQDALVQISSLSNRLQRERAAAIASASTGAAGSMTAAAQNDVSSPSQPQQLDNYLEYFDDPEQNSELDDMMDDEAPSVGQYAHSTLANDIKSECEDNADEYEPAERALDEDDHDVDDADMRNFVLSTLEKRQQHLHQQQQQQRLQHFQRMHSRTFYDDFRHKRTRSQENISSSHNASGNSLTAASSNHSATNNVSFVRPTFSKPLDAVSTTSQNHNSNGGSSTSSTTNTINSTLINDTDPVSNSTPRLNNTHHHSSPSTSHFSPLSHGASGGGNSSAMTAHHSHQRFEISSMTSSSSNNTITNATSAASALQMPASAPTPELCDCKTDPDAMFLMSLLPDIQKLNGRDRGKIKIAFQNILQDFLYPD